MRFCSIVGQASIQTARASGPSTMDRSSGLLPPLGIQAPWPRPGGGDIEPNKTEQDGGMPLIEHRPKALWRVAQEIRDGHLACEDEGHRPGEQSDEQEQAAKRLEDSGYAGQRHDRRGAPAWHDGRRKREQLGRPELHEEKGGNDPQDAEQVRRPGRPLRDDAWCSHDVCLSECGVEAALRQRPSRRASPRRSTYAANAPVGPRHWSSSTFWKRTASVLRVASCLNSNARSRLSPSTFAGKSSMRPY